MRWIGDVKADTGTQVARLFMVPGMTHCGGGSGYEDFDPLTTLEDWVKVGQVPETMVARSPSRPGQEMPLCAWPAHAQFKGGNLRSADSFVCQVD